MSNEKRRRESRALIGAEDRSLIGSNTRISQYTQSENALKLRLKDIDHSHQQTNRRISHETHELKQILQGLQRDLKVSRPLRHYVPTQLEKREVEPRRRRYTAASAFPAPAEKLKTGKGLDDVERTGEKTAPEVPRVEIPSNEYLTKRRRSSSMPIIQDAKELQNIQPEVEDDSRPGDEDGGTECKEQSALDVAPIKMSTGESTDHDTKQTAITIRSTRSEKMYTKRLSAEQLLQNARKRSMTNAGAFSNAFLGRFITSESGSAQPQAVTTTPQLSRSRRMTVGHRADMTDAPRKRLSVQVSTPFSSSAYQPTLRTSLSYPQWSGNSSRNLNSANISSRMSPLAEMADEQQLEGSGRRVSASYRTRSRRRTATLPPLTENPAAKKRSAESEVWNELSNCRYLRRQEDELTIDDIFRKD